MANPVSSWATYVRIKREDGARLIVLEVWSALGLAIVFLIFWTVIGLPNSFGKDGLIDGLGSITSVLAGFYVAGLVAIATFFRENSSLDDVITQGPAILNFGSDDEERLTRRQFVCSIFGFLVFLSFSLAISSVIFRSSASVVAAGLDEKFVGYGNLTLPAGVVVEGIAVFSWIFLFSWQVIATLRGLYYLMDRIYDVKPVLGKKPPRITRL